MAPRPSASLPFMTTSALGDRRRGHVHPEVDVFLRPGVAERQERHALLVDRLRSSCGRCRRSAPRSAPCRGRRCRPASRARTCSFPCAGCPTSVRHSSSIGTGMMRYPWGASSAIAASHAARMSASSWVAHLSSTSSTASRRQRAEAVARQQHLLVEGEGQVGRVAPVGDRALADADAVAACALGHPGRRLDLGRDDLHRPDAVAHLGGDGAEDLPALLGAFARVGDDLDGVLGQPRRDGARRARGRGGGGGHDAGDLSVRRPKRRRSARLVGVVSTGVGGGCLSRPRFSRRSASSPSRSS